MPWIYDVSSATFTAPNGSTYSAQYSGARGYYDNSEYECLADRGPIPRGRYTIRPSHNSPQTGVVTLGLIPHESNNMCGRHSFAIHEDSQRDPGGASQGCIIANLSTRTQINESNDKVLIVR